MNNMPKTAIRSALVAGLFLTASVPSMAAPAAVAPVAQGVAVVSLPAAIANSNAFKVAEQQRPVTYKPQIDQANTRSAQIQAQIKPLVDKLQADQKAGVATEALQKQYGQIQEIQQAAQSELAQIIQPVKLSQAYVQEQIEDLLDKAVQAAAKKKNTTLILDASAGAVVFADAKYNITQDVINELNTLLPSAQLVPPPGWLPREMREQQQAAAAAQAGQSGTTAATPPATVQQPTGR